MKKIYVLLFIGILLSSIQGYSQVTTNGGSGLAGTYPTLKDAIVALNAAAITSPVTITLAGNETAPAGGYTITAQGTATNTITIAGSSSTVQAFAPQTSGLITDAVFKLVGADYVTIQGFTITENSANTTTALATNNMTEWGIALLYTSTTNGSQNNTIQNNTIDLDRTYVNSIGIYSSSSHSSTAATTVAASTGTSGNNSGLKVYSNTVTDVNLGIVVIGPGASTPVAADYNDGLDIGGSAASTANTISNFGTNGTLTALYPNLSTGTVPAIFVRYTKNYNISYNNITSSVGGTTSGSLRGVYVPSFSTSPRGAITNLINNNSFSLKSGVSAAITAVSVEASTTDSTSTLNINNNDFNNTTYTVTSSGVITFITTVAVPLVTNISGNTFTNLNVNTTGSVAFITASFSLNYTTIAGSKNINNNSIVTGFTKTGAGGTINLILDNGSSTMPATSNCLNNNFSNINVTGATTITGISYTDGGTAPKKNVNGNTLASWTGGTNSINCLNVTYLTDTSSISNNIISNITGQSTVTGMTIGSAANTGKLITVAGNTITGLSSTGTGGAVTGISCSNTSTLININENTIHTLSTSAGSAVLGISVTGATNTNVTKNKIGNLSGAAASSTAAGIQVSGSTATLTVTLANNVIGDIRLPISTGSSNALNGINITNTTSGGIVNAYYNTVYINAVSTGATFGSSAISVTTSITVTLRNNIFVNTSTAVGATGFTVAYRRSNTTLSTYGSASNNNLFYAGTPSATNLIYYQGSTAVDQDQTIAAYKTRVAPRDAGSVTENVAAFFISTSVADAGFLHITPGSQSLAESGAENIAGITDDIDNQVRAGNPGYSGVSSKPDIGADEFVGPSCSGAPAPSSASVNIPLPACPGLPFTLSLSQSYSYVTYQWESSQDNINFVAIQGAVNPTYTTSTTVNTYYRAVISCSGANTISGSVYVDMKTQMNGVFTIDNTIATGGNNFASFKEALDDLNCRGVNGPVTFNVSAGQIFASSDSLNVSATGTATNTITFRKSGSGANPVVQRLGNSLLNNYILRLVGADYVTFDGIDFQQTGTTSADWVEFGIVLQSASGTDGAQNNVFRNGTITLDKANTSSRGIQTTSLAAAASGTNRNNSFLNMDVENAYYGYNLVGVTAALDSNNVIDVENGGISKVNNIGGGASSQYGILATYQKGFKVKNTEISNVTATGTALVYGLALQSSSLNSCEFANNHIHDISGIGTVTGINITSLDSGNVYNNHIHALYTTTATSSAVKGIDMSASGSRVNIYSNRVYNISSAGLTATTATGIDIGGGLSINAYNNMVSDLRAGASTSTTGGTRGIAVTSGSTGSIMRLYHNSIYLNDVGTVAGYTSAGILNNSTTPVLDLRNNVVINKTDITNGARVAAFWKTSSTLNIDSATDNNLYFAGTPSATRLIYYDGTNSAQTISSYKSLTGIAPRETNSVTEDVVFAGITEGILRPAAGTATLIESGGKATNVTVDFENQPRGPYPMSGQANGGGTKPDLGADEGDYIFIVPPVPDCVTSVTPADGTAGICPSFPLRLKWSPASTGGNPGLGYDIYFGTGANPPLVTTTASLFYNLPSLTGNTTYYFKIVPKNNSGSASGCQTYSFSTANLGITGVTNGNKCGPGSVTLSATANGTVRWFNSLTGGSVLATGNSFSPTVNSDSTFYVAASSLGTPERAGLSEAQAGTSATAPSTYGLVFNTVADINIDSVTVILGTATGGPMVIELRDSSANSTGAGTLRSTVTVQIPNGTIGQRVRIRLGFSVPVGQNYRLLAVSGPSLIRSSSIGGFPYTSPTGNVSIWSGFITNSASSSYYYFYDWQVTPICESTPRQPVTVTYRTAPTVTATASQTAICAGQSTNLNVTSSNDPNYSYTWLPGNLSGAAQTVSPTATTTYTVTATDNTSGANATCSTTGSVTVSVNPIPATPVVTPASSSTFCFGGSKILTASSGTGAPAVILAQNFNSGLNGWSVVNGTGHTAGTEWLIKTPPYAYSTSITNWNGFDGSSFIIANSDISGSSANLTFTQLKSPVFSSAEFSSVSVKFKHFFRSSSEFAGLEHSIDGGNTWIIDSVLTASTTGGGSNPPAITNAVWALKAGAAGQASLQIRFRYDASYDWYWGIDDIEIIGTPVPVYAWTASPANGSGLPANAGTPSDANASINVTPTTAGTYVYSAKAYFTGTGCASDAATVTLTSTNVNSWTGAANNNLWEDAGNWTCGVPSTNADVSIPDNSLVNINSNVTVRSMSVEGLNTIVNVKAGFTLTVAH